MSSEKKHGPLQVKRLEGEALDWVERALATGIKYKYVVTAFLETFPECQVPRPKGRGLLEN